METFCYIIFTLSIISQQQYHSSQDPKWLDSDFQALSETLRIVFLLDFSWGLMLMKQVF